MELELGCLRGEVSLVQKGEERGLIGEGKVVRSLPLYYIMVFSVFQFSLDWVGISWTRMNC